LTIHFKFDILFENASISLGIIGTKYLVPTGH